MHVSWVGRVQVAVVLACAVTFTAPVRGEAGGDPVMTLTVLTTNDVHGRIQQLPLLGGYIRNVRAARARDGGAVLLLDGGDIFQGTIESNASEGAAMVRAYRALGYSAVTLGNHEFDYGPVGPHPIPVGAEDPLGAIKARVAEAPFPFLNANLQGPEGKPLAIPKLRQSVILRPGGVRVGLIGGMTMDLLRTTHSGNTRDVRVASLSDSVAEQARRLRKEGARVVIALVHAGGECHDLRAPDDLSSCDDNAEVFRLARALPAGSVDMIVAGHTHSGVAQRVNGIAIVEAFSNGRAFGRVDFEIPRSPSGQIRVQMRPPESLCTESLDKLSCAAGVTYEGAPVERDASVLRAIASDLRAAHAARERMIGLEVVAAVRREGKVESPLNNLISDLMLQAWPGADAAFSNAGAVRIPLPKGPLRYGTVFEMFPFDNTFATLQIPARQLASILANNLQSSTGILSLAGLRGAASCKDGQLTVQLFDLAGKPVDPDRPLSVITSDFLAGSGDGVMNGQKFAPNALAIVRERSVRDALLEGLIAWPGGKLDGNDKRLYDAEQPRVRYDGTRPLSCAVAAGKP
ncbi:MAG: bifunctional UDP-sugar hydrolase/5'-nucleotidase [Polyangiales bacterium]